VSFFESRRIRSRSLWAAWITARSSRMPGSCRACASPFDRILVAGGRVENRAYTCRPGAWRERTIRAIAGRGRDSLDRALAPGRGGRA
jgi:hypothetical protein